MTEGEQTAFAALEPAMDAICKTETKPGCAFCGSATGGNFYTTANDTRPACERCAVRNYNRRATVPLYQWIHSCTSSFSGMVSPIEQ